MRLPFLIELLCCRYHQVRELAAQLLGPRCLDVAQSYSDIGCAYNAMGQHDRALEFHSKALVIQGENLGPRNKYLASTYVPHPINYELNFGNQ